MMIHNNNNQKLTSFQNNFALALQSRLLWKTFFTLFCSFALIALVAYWSGSHADQESQSLKYLEFSALVLFFISAALFLALRFCQPILGLRQACNSLRHGKFFKPPALRSKDEIGEMLDIFAHLSNEIISKLATISLERAQLKSMLTGMVEGIISVDANGHLLFCNAAAHAFLSMRAQPHEGKKIDDIPECAPFIRALADALAEGKVVHGEISRKAPNQVLEYNVAPFTADQCSGAILVLHEVTRLRQLERIRRDFVANVSHELKTPLTSIKGYVETLLGGAIHDERFNVRFLQKIHKNAERLVLLVQDILSLARIEDETQMLSTQKVSWPIIIHQVLARLENEVNSKRLRIVCHLSENFEVQGEPEALSQIADNLLSNAIRYSLEGGKIMITLRSNTDFGILDVADTGIGIGEEHLDRIFERFYRVDKDRSRELGGTGLGLAIVKHMVSKMNGKITVHSKVNEGSCFSVYLPKAKSSA